jgi:hypothetical protein
VSLVEQELLVLPEHLSSAPVFSGVRVFYYVFAIPVGIIILVNAIIFGMILKNLLSSPKGLQSNQSERKTAPISLSVKE